MGKLVNDIEKLDLSDREKLIMTMFPGILFGFPPQNLKQLTERIDCPTCKAIAEKLKKINDLKMPSGWRYKIPWVRKAWREQANTDAKETLNNVKSLETQDKAHWENADERRISKEFVTAFVKREDWEHKDEE
mgnify:CR=1 FL=1